MPQITFMRHGQTTYNLDRVFSGRTDCHLTEKGREDACKLKFDKNLFDVYFCSTLIRTKETLECLVGNVNPILDNRIVEVDLGDFTNTPITKEKVSIINECRNSNKRVLNVETKMETEERVKSFINDLFNKYDDDDTKIFVVSHNGVLMLIKELYFENYINTGSSNLETVTINKENYELSNKTLKNKF